MRNGPASFCFGMIRHHFIPVNVVLMSVSFLQSYCEQRKRFQTGSYRFVPIDKYRVNSKVGTEAGDLFFVSKLGDPHRHA